MFERISNWVIKQDPKAHLFRLNNCLKDIRYFNQMVEDAGMTSLVGQATQHAYMLAKANGMGDKPMPRLFDMIMTLNHLTTKDKDAGKSPSSQ